MAVLDFDAATHTYRIHGITLPSVTQLLKPLTDEAFAGIPQSILDNKSAIGTAVHYATELYDADDIDTDDLHPTVLNYLLGWSRFIGDHEGRIQIVRSESKQYHPTLQYAGTVDRELLFDGEPMILDIKTTDQIHAHVGVQLAGYAMLAEANSDKAKRIPANRYKRVALQLLPDSDYKLHYFTEQIDFTCFMSMLTFYNWKAKFK